MSGLFWLVTRFGAADLLVRFSTFWLLKHAKNLTLFGHRFANFETFWIVYIILLTPIWWFANYLFFSAYSNGYYTIFPNRAWSVQLVAWMTSIIIMLLTALLYLKELPTRNALIAIVCLAGALLAILFDKG